MDSSIRSRQTGQVGNSTKDGVGGAWGLDDRELDEMGAPCRVEDVELGASCLVTEGVKGSLVMSGKEASCPGVSCVRNSMDLTKTTWQFSGYSLSAPSTCNLQKSLPPCHQKPCHSTLSSTV